MSEKDAEKWNRHFRACEASVAEPSFVLSEYAHLLPQQGEALELAAGLGGNALYLAQRGLNSTAWDISTVAMDKLASRAADEGVSLSCEVRDVIAQPPAAQSYDVIVVSRFLERDLCPDLSDALRPGGLLFYQTFTREKDDPTIGPINPAYLLERNELLRLFPSLTVRIYREEGLRGDTAQGLRNQACLVAERCS
jgi:tellurite methyltransferase